jgi:hypothetical protein
VSEVGETRHAEDGWGSSRQNSGVRKCIVSVKSCSAVNVNNKLYAKELTLFLHRRPAKISSVFAIR